MQLNNNKNSLILISILLCLQLSLSTDPCLTPNEINDWRRSAGYETGASDSICDSFMIPQWYRITSKAGELMPTECIDGGYRCGTAMPFWLSSINVPANEDVYPSRGKQVSRIACASHYSGDCCKYNVTIDINNCGDYNVYHLQPTPYCPTGYCFGKEIPCPPGTYSETGFTPGCASYPDVEVPKPTVTTGFQRTETKFEVFQKVIFQCSVTVDTKYTVDVHWYINGDEIDGALYKNKKADEISTALLQQQHWENDYKPNMQVSCSIQLRQTGFQAPTPPQFSDDFFAGIIVDYKEEHKLLIEDAPPKNIAARLTIPVGCSYPKNGANIEAEQKLCVINLLGAVPDYQENGLCIPDKVNEGLDFHAVQCGIYFNYTDWNTPHELTVSGTSDERVNFQPRVMYLRLYINALKAGTGKDVLNFWDGFVYPDLKFLIADSDYNTVGSFCSSDNDPHMKTFDGKRYDFHKTEGEYILYKNTNLPVTIHAYYQKCDYYWKHNGGALCNCGAAVRSGNSIFIANFCHIKNRQNRYAIQKICDEQDLKVTGGNNRYQIQIMSGTKVVITFGEVTKPGEDFYGIQTFQVYPSKFDKQSTTGLCGSLNNNPGDDLTPQGEETAIGDAEAFAASWRIKSHQKEDSLFDINNIKPITETAKPYCTCKKNADEFPYGEPNYSCNYTEAIHSCSQISITNTVYKAQCKKNNVRVRRDVSILDGDTLQRTKRNAEPDEALPGDVIELDDDDAPVMYAMDLFNGVSELPDLSWKNSWSEEKARTHCSETFQSSVAFSICDENVKAVPSQDYIDKCVADIQLTGESNWDAATVNNFATACLNIASKLDNLTQINGTNSTGNEVSIFNLIQEATCPKNCSGKGKCIDGQCICRDPYFGPACEVEKTQAPKLASAAFYGLCDTRLKPCHRYNIPGMNFREGNLTCRYKHFTISLNETSTTGIQEISDGIYSSPFIMQCPAPESRRKRSLTKASSAFGYFISVSNDGKNFTEDLTVIIYDSLCFSCSTANLTCIEMPTCPQYVERKNEKSNTGAYIGAASAGAFFIILVLGVFTIIKKKVLKGRSSVTDSTVNLANNEPVRKGFLNPQWTSN